MADVQPLRALHYDLAKVGSLSRRRRAALRRDRPRAARGSWPRRSPYNVVAIDLPEADGDDPYAARRRASSSGWQRRGRRRPRRRARAVGARPGLHRPRRPRAAPATAFFARVRVEDYGPGRIRPHERTHPGPKEDRLRLTRATQANLSPDLQPLRRPRRRRLERARAAHARPSRGARRPTTTAPSTGCGAIADAGGDRRPSRPRCADAELLIADGHHRYETARVYAEEIGGEGEHRYVLMCLVALQDPGLTVFPTHRLIRDTTPQTQEALASTLREPSTSRRSTTPTCARPTATGPLTHGLHRRPLQARASA